MKRVRPSGLDPFVLALPIFPVRLQTSIFGRSELNFRVRNGNGWTLALINTNYNFLLEKKVSKENIIFFSPYHLLNSKYYNHFFQNVKKNFKMVTRTGIEPMFAA